MKDLDPLIAVTAVCLASIFAWFVGVAMGFGIGLVVRGAM